MITTINNTSTEMETSSTAVGISAANSVATGSNYQGTPSRPKTVADRLRKLKAKWEERLEIEGMKAGRKWALRQFGTPALERLALSADLWWSLTCYDYSDRPVGELLYYTLRPEHDGDQEAALHFWDLVTGAPELPDRGFVCAFAETAQEIWQQSQD